jgi:hypothetical protein
LSHGLSVPEGFKLDIYIIIKSSEPIRFTIHLILPVSGVSLQIPSIPIFHRYRSSIDTAIDTDIPSIPIFHQYRTLFKFSKSILPFLPSYSLVNQFGGESQILQSRIDSRVSRLRNFLLTGILPYTAFTFEVPEHQSYILYISSRSLPSILYYTEPVTSLQV